MNDEVKYKEYNNIEGVRISFWSQIPLLLRFCLAIDDILLGKRTNKNIDIGIIYWWDFLVKGN